jgi:hypothetical protein
MVQASTLLVAAAFVVAPVLAAPPPHHHHKHIAADIEAREPNPKFSFGKIFRGVANVVKKAAPIALKAGSLLLRRDEEGNLYVRELDEDELSYLQARDPKFNLGRTFRKVGGAVSKGIRVANRVAGAAQSFGLRELDDGIYLEEREFDPMDFEFEERDFDFDLDERDFEEFDELDARDPKFNLGRVLGKARGIAGKALRVADRVSSTAHSFGLREFDDEVMEARSESLDELD